MISIISCPPSYFGLTITASAATLVTYFSSVYSTIFFLIMINLRTFSNVKIIFLKVKIFIADGRQIRAKTCECAMARRGNTWRR